MWQSRRRSLPASGSVVGRKTPWKAARFPHCSSAGVPRTCQSAQNSHCDVTGNVWRTTRYRPGSESVRFAAEPRSASFGSGDSGPPPDVSCDPTAAGSAGGGAVSERAPTGLLLRDPGRAGARSASFGRSDGASPDVRVTAKAAALGWLPELRQRRRAWRGTRVEERERSRVATSVVVLSASFVRGVRRARSPGPREAGRSAPKLHLSG